MNLIVPMAGRSSRFPGVRPKWMLTHPNGNFMALEAIASLDLDAFERLCFVCLEEHEQEFHFRKGFEEELEQAGLLSRSTIVQLPTPTRDQPETVYQGILAAGVRGPVFVKDSDNQFSARSSGGNHICYADLNNMGLIQPNCKSYITVNEFGSVTNIIEKKVISQLFCVGGYGFADADELCKTIASLGHNRERYMSNVIYQRLLEGDTFEAIPAEHYSDWGTLEDWERYKRKFGTLFIDLDGVIVKHSAAHFPPYYGESGLIEDNADVVRELHDGGRFQIIITTSRPERFREVTEKQLKDLGVSYHYLIMGLNHAKRIVINDYSRSNPYKSCDAINIKRNGGDLREILRDALEISYGTPVSAAAPAEMAKAK